MNMTIKHFRTANQANIFGRNTYVQEDNKKIQVELEALGLFSSEQLYQRMLDAAPGWARTQIETGVYGNLLIRYAWTEIETLALTPDKGLARTQECFVIEGNI